MLGPFLAKWSQWAISSMTAASTPFRMRMHAREIAVNMPARETLLNGIRERLLNGTGFALATVNLDHMVKLKNNAEFGEAYAAHDFVVADGNPVVWLSRLAGNPVDLVPGADLVEPLANLAAETNTPVALLGSSQKALDLAAGNLTALIPGLRIVARLAPSNPFDPVGPEADEMIEALAASGARLTFVALGAPKQEVFAARALERVGYMGFASIGAGLDFIAGRQRRAPIWMQRAALEWLWRVAGNPRRLALRYARCAMIMPQLAVRAFRERKPDVPTRS